MSEGAPGSGLLLPGIRAVFFDVVGTLLVPDPPAIAVYRAIAGAAGLDIPAATIRSRFVEAYLAEEAADRAAGWITSEDRERSRWRNIVAASLRELSDPDAAFDVLFRHFARPGTWRLTADAEALITSLADGGLAVGLGSNYDRRLLSVLEGFPVLASLKPRTAISSVVGVRKPAAEFFRAVVNAAGVESHEVLFVGDDAENDYLGARAAGLRAVLYDPDGKGTGPERIRGLAEVMELPRASALLQPRP